MGRGKKRSGERTASGAAPAGSVVTRPVGAVQLADGSWTTTLYHCTARSEAQLAKIRSEGLRPFSRGYGGYEDDGPIWAPSVFFFDSLEDAETYFYDMTIIAVDVAGLDIRPDPHQGTEHGRAWRYEGTISPERLSLAQPEKLWEHVRTRIWPDQESTDASLSPAVAS